MISKLLRRIEAKATRKFIMILTIAKQHIFLMVVCNLSIYICIHMYIYIYIYIYMCVCLCGVKI